GVALHSRNKPDEAIACYKKAIELDPKLATTLYNLGTVLRERKKLDEAATCFRRAIEIDPEYGEAYSGLGNVLNAQHRPDEAAFYFRRAIEHLRRAIELDPKSRGAANAYHRIGQIFEGQGKLKEAIDSMQKSADVPDPGHAAHQNALAWLLTNCPEVS